MTRRVPPLRPRIPSIFPMARARPLRRQVLRIGHLGDVKRGHARGALAITEMALALAGIPHKKGGVQCRDRLF